MVLSYGGWLIVLGILGAANLIIARMPKAGEWIGKIAPYQGWFGVLSVFYGLWEVKDCLFSMSVMAIRPPIGLIVWLLFLANGILQILLGILLGVGVAKSFVKQPQAVEKMDATVRKLAPFQGILGFAAIGVGIAFVIFEVLL